jgi:hypothetical protein
MIWVSTIKGKRPLDLTGLDEAGASTAVRARRHVARCPHLEVLDGRSPSPTPRRGRHLRRAQAGEPGAFGCQGLAYGVDGLVAIEVCEIGRTRLIL